MEWNIFIPLKMEWIFYKKYFQYQRSMIENVRYDLLL